jgi:hypothetical protein
VANSDPQSTFRGLPLTPEQDAEVRHYIKVRTQHGLPWDTAELHAMLRDMLRPPAEDNADVDPAEAEMKATAERATGFVDEEIDPIEANEERNAAMESEWMKGLKR